jgi:hypothetical protein
VPRLATNHCSSLAPSKGYSVGQATTQGTQAFARHFRESIPEIRVVGSHKEKGLLARSQTSTRERLPTEMQCKGRSNSDRQRPPALRVAVGTGTPVQIQENDHRTQTASSVLASAAPQYSSIVPGTRGGTVVSPCHS